MALDYSVLFNQPRVADQIGSGIQNFYAARAVEDAAKQRQIENQRAEDAAARQAAFIPAFQSVLQSGDKNALAQLMAQFPEQYQAIKNIAGFQDERQAQALGSLGVQLNNAIKSGNQTAAAQLIAANQDVLRNAGPGYEPEGLLQRLQQDPDGLATQADQFSLLALGPEKYYEVMGARDKIDTQRRGQDITMRGQDIQQQEGALDRQQQMTLKQLTLQDKALDREVSSLNTQIANESNALKRRELELRLEEKQTKLDNARADRQAAAESTANTFGQAVGSAERLLTHPGLEKSVGFNSVFPTAPGSDAADFEAQLDTFKAQTFLPQVQSLKGMGALSDAEGKKLAESVGALSLKMKPETFKNELQRVKSTLEAAQQRALKGVPKLTTQQTSDDELLQKYGGL